MQRPWNNLRDARAIDRVHTCIASGLAAGGRVMRHRHRMGRSSSTGALVIYFVRNDIAKGFALGRV